MRKVYVISDEKAPRQEIDKLKKELQCAGYSVFTNYHDYENYKKRFEGDLSNKDRSWLRIKRLLACDNISILEGYAKDKMCKLEMNIAQAIGKDIVKVLGSNRNRRANEFPW